MAQKKDETMSKTEIIENMPYRDYAARPGLRATYLKAFAESTPASAEYQRTHQSDSAALRWGSALHCMILEPERFAAEYTIGGPVNPKTNAPYGSETKAFMEWAASQPKPILTREEHRLIVGMADSISAHPLARTIRDGPRKTELSIFWETAGVPCQARLDCVQPRVIWDIKTCREASYRGFLRAIGQYSYHMAAAWYLEGAKAVGLINGSCRYLWLAVENAAPYNVAVYEASAELLAAGAEQNCAAVARYLECKDKGVFPASYANDAIVMDCPKWLQSEPEVEI